MALPARPIHIPAGLLIDELTRPELLEPGTANVANSNVRMDETGSLVKRRGYTSLATTRFTGSARSSALRMFMNADQICTIDSTPELDVYSTSLARSVVCGRVPEASVRLREVPCGGANAPPSVAGVTVGDCVAVSGGAGGTYVAIAHLVYNAAGNPFANVALLDADNGATVLAPKNLQQASGVTLASYSTYILAFVNLSTNLVLYKLDLTSATTIATGWVSVATIGTDFDGGTGCVQAVQLPAGNGCAIAYKNNSGGANPITVRTANQAGQIASTTLPATTAQLTMVALSEGTSVLWLAYNQTTSTRAMALNETTLAVTVASASVMTGGSPQALFVGPRTAGTAAVYVSDATTDTRMVAIQNSAGTAAAAGSVALLANCRVLSRPIFRSGRLYAHVASSQLAEMVFCDVTPDTTSTANLVTFYRPVAAPIQRELFNQSGFRTALIPNTNKYLHSFSVRRSGTTAGPALSEYDFASAYRWKPAVLNTSTWLSGGVASIFDGTRTFEAGFLTRPGTPQIISTASAGSVTLTTGRLYVCTHEDIDADGNWHVSGVSLPSGSTGAITSKQISLTVVPLSITSRGFTTTQIATTNGVNGLRNVLWATLDGGSTYYRLAEIQNDPNASTTAYVDNTTDATLATQALLYGTGQLPGTNNASQDHRAPPGLTYVVSYAGMLVGANGSTLYFSSQPIDGEGQWFSPVLTRSVDEEVTGLTVQDGAILIFTRSGIWVTSGEPPSDNALQGGLATPRRLAVDQGCINANSIVTTAIGTFFQSDRGLELLTRGYTLTPIGDKVWRTLAANPVVTAAVLDTENGLVIFSLAESQTSGVASTNGKDLVFDLSQAGWVSTDSKRGSTTTQASQDAAMAYIAGAWRYAWISTGGTVYYERAANDASAHVDGASWVQSYYTTPHVKFGLQQEMRTYEMELLVERHSPGGLSVEIANDYGAFNVEPAKEWDATATADSRHFPFRPRANSDAIQLRVADTEGGVLGTGKGFSFIGISADVAPKQGATRGTPRLAASLRR